MENWFFSPDFLPRLKPRECIQIRGKFYEVVETRPAFPFEFKQVGIANTVDIDLKEQGLKALEGEKLELLNIRLKIYGPVKCVIRLEGAGGPVFGGWGAAERYADENTSPNLLEFMLLGERTGWLFVRVIPIAVPAWIKIKAEGYVYILRELPKAPATYSVPAYIS